MTRVSAIVLTVIASAGAHPDTIQVAGSGPLTGVYFFTHWWDPWKRSDQAILQDLRKLRALGFNTIFLDHQWSQMIDGDWRLIDRGHRLAREAGVQILPWLGTKAGLDLGTTAQRRELVQQMYGAELRMGRDRDGNPNRTLPWDEAVIEVSARYCVDYLDRYKTSGALLHVTVDGKDRPVIAPTVELDWEGSCDAETEQMFRLWLRARYGTIQKLNEAWGTSIPEWAGIRICDEGIFDLRGHAEGKARHPRAVEDHVEFRAQVMDISLGEISRRIRERHPDVLIATELPYQFGSQHPHAIGYRIGQGANPSSARHADILVLRATGPLTEEEIRLLDEYRRDSGQKVILTYRTYPEWGRHLIAGKATALEMARTYGEQAARVADGFGLYSWNEMVDCHVASGSDPSYADAFQVTAEESAAVVRAMEEMARRFTQEAMKKR